MPANVPRTSAVSPLASVTPCSRCGAARACAMEAGTAAETPCWCQSMPVLPAAWRTGAASCLCPDCLRAALGEAGCLPGAPGDPTSGTGNGARPD
ncbi:MAG TPA: cysteine-rich CWC family protein [Burkholderiaceae bacterium]|nr:cysteine-rich CWC family protein [Burkholderiaceae bacterium]